VFWTCHCDVILGLGREGATCNSEDISGKKFHDWKLDFRAKKFG